MQCITCEKFVAASNGLCGNCNDDVFSGGYVAATVAKKLLLRSQRQEAELFVFLNDALAMQKARIAELESQLAHATVTIESRNVSADLLTVLQARRVERDRIAELESQLAAALATIEREATGAEWQDKPLTYIAVEDPESGAWGIEDHLGGILYESDMTQAQALALATAHNAGVEGFDEALDWLQAHGMDWATFATGKDYVEGCAP